MMQLTPRACVKEDDFWKTRNFLREIFRLNGSVEHSWHVARLDYWRWHYIKTCNIFKSIHEKPADFLYRAVMQEMKVTDTWVKIIT